MAGCFIRFLAAVVLVGLVMDPRAKAEIQCSDALSQVLPCEAYLLSGAGAPSAACCSAVQSLSKMATASAGDRKALCQCFKQIASSLPVNLPKAQQLPDLCHVSIGGVKIDPNVDCDR
ncbi:non-specific lipid-transfer protein [Phtheirospermum japonicum]|uniref:Non-specific lipid-transfer protein n=1 Tax=Phtheirospermum japonicum TaxID=374723 RepID=A0A830CSX5_9LAMI|nr:non-specific lipid-transfer protein [Phtheirospermum japonicum]